MVSTGSPGGRRPAQRRPQAGEQLVDAERLGHVVVGAGVERSDLLALVADRREDDAPAPTSRCEARGRRRCRCRRAARGRGSPHRAGGSRPRASASCGGRRRSRPRSRRRAGRAASARRICGSSSTTSTRCAAHAAPRPAPRRPAGPARTRRPGPRATRPRPGRRWPRRTRARSRGRGRRPERGRAPARWNGSKMRSSSSSSRPGPWSVTRTIASRRLPRRARSPASGRRELERVLDQVGEHPLDLERRRRDERARRPAATPRRARAPASSSSACATSSSSGQSSRAGAAAPAWSRERSSRFGDQAVEPVRPRARSSRAARRDRPRSRLSVVASERADGGEDRHERRAQVVEHRPQQRGLAASLRRSASASRPRARAARGRAPPRAAPRAPAGTAAARQRGSLRPLGVVDRADHAAGRPRAGTAPRPRRRPPALAELDRCAASTPRTSAARSPIAPSSSSTSAPAQELGGRDREQRRLALALLRVCARRRERAASSLTTTAVPEVDGEREPVLALRDGERVHRREEEAVEREHAGHRDGERVAAGPRPPRPAARRRRRARRG